MKKPYKILWWSALAVLLLSLLGFEKSFDLQMHDTYFVIAVLHLGLYGALLFGMLGGVYYIMRNRRWVHWMSWLHLATTLLPVFILVILSITGNNYLSLHNNVSQSIFILLLSNFHILIFSQLVFFINLLVTLFRSPSQKISNKD